jgi:hypothetical protein
MRSSNFIYSTVIFLISNSYASKFISHASSNNSLITEVHSKCSKSENIIQTSSELAAISDCSVIYGNIYISDFDSDILYLNSIKEVKGDLIVKNSSSLVRMEAINLNTVGGKLELNTLNSLTSLVFPSLENVEALKWQVLPILTFVDLSTGIKNINSIIMSDTSLTGFGGFNVESLKTLSINNNRFLEKIESTVSEITGDLLIAANADNIEVSLPNLTSVKSMTIKDTEKINLESLQIVEKNADFTQNGFSALDLSNMKSIGHTLSIIKNKNLKEVKFDKLSEVGGGLMIIDNNKLNKFDFFVALKTIGGAIEFRGNVNSNHFKELKIIKGSAIMKSSSEELDCSNWMKNEVGKVVRGGKVECGSGKSSTTEVLLVDESGESTNGEPGINENNNNNSIKDQFVKQKSNASSYKFSKKMSIIIAAYSAIILLQIL